MEAQKFKLTYLTQNSRYLDSVKSVDKSAIRTFIHTVHAKLTSNSPTAITLDKKINIMGNHFNYSQIYIETNLGYFICI